MRMHIRRRLTRLTNGFSKLRVTPAMEAGITDWVWMLGKRLG
jgi:hypothetical protein